MRYFALAVFGLHIFAETAFGLRGFLSGTFSWQMGVDMGEHTAQLALSARFLAAGLFASVLVALWPLSGPGIQSSTTRVAAAVLSAFHGLGVLGVLITAFTYPEIWARANTIGALVIHSLLGLGFLTVYLWRRFFSAKPKRRKKPAKSKTAA